MSANLDGIAFGDAAEASGGAPAAPYRVQRPALAGLVDLVALRRPDAARRRGSPAPSAASTARSRSSPSGRCFAPPMCWGRVSFPRRGRSSGPAYKLTLSGELGIHLRASLLRVLEGGVPGLFIGVALAVLAGTLTLFEDVIDSLVQILKAIPEFTIVPLLIIWMGINDAPKITLIMMSVASPVYLNMYGAIRGVDGRLIEAAKTLGLGYWQRVWHIVPAGFGAGLSARAPRLAHRRLAVAGLRRDDQCP